MPSVAPMYAVPSTPNAGEPVMLFVALNVHNTTPDWESNPYIRLPPHTITIPLEDIAGDDLTAPAKGTVNLKMAPAPTPERTVTLEWLAVYPRWPHMWTNGEGEGVREGVGVSDGVTDGVEEVVGVTLEVGDTVGVTVGVALGLASAYNTLSLEGTNRVPEGPTAGPAWTDPLVDSDHSSTPVAPLNADTVRSREVTNTMPFVSTAGGLENPADLGKVHTCTPVLAFSA